MFGGMIASQNAQRADKLATEAESARQLHQHLLQLQGQEAEQEMARRGELGVYEHDKHQWEAEDRQKAGDFENWLASPEGEGASTNDITRHAAMYGQKGMVSPYATLAGKEAQADSKGASNFTSILKNFDTAKASMDAKGIPSPKQADLLEAEYGGIMPPEVFEKMRAAGPAAAPMVQAKINEINTKAGLNTAQAGKAARTGGTTGASIDQKIQDRIQKYDKMIADMTKPKLGMSPTETNRAKKAALPYMKIRDDLARSAGKPTAFDAQLGTNVPGAPTPIAPSPSTTSVEPPAPPKYASPDDVKNAVKAKKITISEAHQILKDQFGFSD